MNISLELSYSFSLPFSFSTGVFFFFLETSLVFYYHWKMWQRIKKKKKLNYFTNPVGKWAQTTKIDPFVPLKYTTHTYQQVRHISSRNIQICRWATRRSVSRVIGFTDSSAKIHVMQPEQGSGLIIHFVLAHIIKRISNLRLAERRLAVVFTVSARHSAHPATFS